MVYVSIVLLFKRAVRYLDVACIFIFIFSFVDMVKLSAEIIEQAAQYTNPVRDRELDLRGEDAKAKLATNLAYVNEVHCVGHRGFYL